MELLNSIDIYTPSGVRSFELWNGDLTSLGFAVDLLMISAVGAQFSPFSNTVIGSLSRSLGISVSQLSKEPDFDFLQAQSRLWVSKIVEPKRIGRLMCVEITYGGVNTAQIVRQAFRILPTLEASGLPLRTICLPVLGAGLHGLTASGVLPPILEGAQWALNVLKSTDRICFVEINLQRATAMSEAMDDVLGRVKVVVPKGQMVEAIRTEIRGQLEKLDIAENGAATVADRLYRAISEEGRSADVGMAGRLLREFVVANLISPADIKKLTPFETTQELRKLLVAEWIISYLNLLHAFGNEAAHHKTQNTHPSEIAAHDLAVCLFTIQRVLDFWFEVRGNINKRK